METTKSLWLSNGAAAALDRYQQEALLTDRNRRTGHDGVSFALLGLFGEVGSLLSELKKKRRDDKAYADYAAGVLEELGDALWYCSNVASRVGVCLSSLTGGELVASTVHSRNADTRMPPGVLASDQFEQVLIQLAGRTGLLIYEFGSGNLDNNMLAERLAQVFQAIIHAADIGDVNLAAAADLNLAKVFDRWPKEGTSHSPLFDEMFEEDEQLPRSIQMTFIEKRVGDRSFVVQKCNEIKIGDRLTDNMAEDDGYRFHDVFHLSYAAILGWSPVLRALFKCKRKSKPTVDEVEDGARAIIIEEGISTWVFNYASQHAFFEGVQSLEYDLLKRIRALVKGVEVERCALWEWERAILSGYGIFRQMRANKGGVVHANLLQRVVSFSLAG
jgi:NTP pyrophosphatase (non-canonical NTP hydrolase)